MANTMIIENGTVGSWAYLVTPDKAYNKKGVYKANIILEEDKIKELEIKFNPELNKLINEEERKKPQLTGKITISDLINDEYKADGTKTERKFIKVKSNFRPKVFNDKGEIIEPEDIYMGSKVNINIGFKPYYNPSTKTVGVSFYINALQVTDLISSPDEFEERFLNKENHIPETSNDFGFGSIENTNDNGLDF
jgi:hypothetical protein